MPEEKRYSVRLRSQIPEQEDLIHVLENLNKKVHGSINQFFIDAAFFYMTHFTDEQLIKETVDKHRKSKLISRQEYETDKEKFIKEYHKDMKKQQETIRISIYQDILKLFAGNILMSGIVQQIPNKELEESSETSPIADEVVNDLMRWSEDDEESKTVYDDIE